MGLIAAIEVAFRAVLNAVKTFVGTLRSKGPERPQAPAAHFGEQEQLEESKYYPPAPSHGLKPEEGELSDFSGETRAVLLVVDTNLVHAYWRVSPDTLREAKRRNGDSSKAVLRFYEASGSFDVDVTLGARNWYVPLWSAGKSYYVDLGLRNADGSFVQLARSNVVLTPRALPIAEAGERFMRAGSHGTRAEIIPTPPFNKPRRPRVPAQQPTTVTPVLLGEASSPTADLATVPPLPFGSSPVVAPYSKPIDSAEILSRKLAEFYALREWSSEPLKPEAAPVCGRGSPWPEEDYSDLTELAEKQQTMGLSSTLVPTSRLEQ